MFRFIKKQKDKYKINVVDLDSAKYSYFSKDNKKKKKESKLFNMLQIIKYKIDDSKLFMKIARFRDKLLFDDKHKLYKKSKRIFKKFDNYLDNRSYKKEQKEIQTEKAIARFKNKIKRTNFKIGKFFRVTKRNIKNNIKDHNKQVKNTISKYNFSKRILVKLTVIGMIGVWLISQSYAWLYQVYNSSGSIISIGEIAHEITEYDEDGIILESDPDTLTLLYESNMSNVTLSTKYIEVKNTGSLDMDYSMAFSLEGTIDVAGLLYYRITDVTSEVNQSTISAQYDTRLKAYAANNPVPVNIESDTSNPISNMSLLNNLIKTGTVELNTDETLNSKYYRIDYGMYSGVNTTLYNSESLSVHINIYSTQVGALAATNAAQVWEVASEQQFREVMLSASAGDTIKLISNVSIDGSINFANRINIDTNEYTLNISGDLIYDFVNLGNLKIDVSGNGRLEIGNDLYINTPKAEVHILGGDKNYDVLVEGETTLNALQDGDEDGILLEDVSMVSSTTTYMPIDVTLLSNTRLTLAEDVRLGFINAATGSTNIEVVNNGTVTQMNFQNMTLLTSFTKPQIYVYNLGDILGVVGTTGIVLPTNATPYLSPNNGNTLIIKGITSSPITVSGSDYFDAGDIDDSQTTVNVVPLANEPDAYIVYIRENNVSVEGLLEEYFENEGSLNISGDIASIKKLIVYTLNAQYFENEDFDFLNSARIPLLEYLSLENSRVKDDMGGTTIYDRIKDNAMNGKTTLDTVLLPSSLVEIGDYAFYNCPLGQLSSNPNDSFTFVYIPYTVTEIGDYAFNSATYVKFMSPIIPLIGDHSFNTTDNGAKFFVPAGAIDDYMDVVELNSSNIYQNAEVSDNRMYFVFNAENGYGISYNANNLNTGTSLGIPNTISYNGETLNTTVIGTNAYRHLEIRNTDGVDLILPSTVVRIDDYAFYQLNIISSSFTNVTDIGSYAFYETNINRLVGNNIATIGDYAFYNNPMTSISLNAIYSIGGYAFYGNTNLKEINFGSVQSIGRYAFHNCPNVTTAYFNTTASELVNNGEEISITLGTNALSDVWGSYTDGRLRIYVPDGLSVNGNTYLSLYKSKISEYANNIYVKGYSSTNSDDSITNGYSSDIYRHLAIDYNFSSYTVKSVTLNNSQGNSVTGWEIISYQGADLTEDYKIPTIINANNQTMNVISIGENAYRNSKVSINNNVLFNESNIINVGSHAFSDLGIIKVEMSGVTTIGSYAFSGTAVEEAKFDSLITLGDNALSGLNSLYSLNIGEVKSLGLNSISNNENLEQLFILNTDMDIAVNGLPFSNIGTNAGGRFRIYVPSGTTSVNYYKSLISSYADYIYPSGYIIGSFVNSPLLYDIGEYTVKEVTLPNYLGVNTTGWEIIEYHGADLTTGYNIPATLTVSSSDLTASKRLLSRTGNTNLYEVTVTNNGSIAVSSWQLNIDLPNTVTLGTISNALYETNNGFVKVYNTTSNGNINAGGSVTFTINLDTLITNYSLYISNVRPVNQVGNEKPVISIGDNAFLHTNVVAGARIDLSSNNLINIGSKAFYGKPGIREIEFDYLLSVGNRAFYSNANLRKITLTNLNRVEAYAFANAEGLYKIDLGKVQIMEGNALTNAPYLEQVFFDVGAFDLSINYAAISNVGSLSNNRIRFYVTDGLDGNGIEYVETYRNLFNTSYSDYFYPRGHIVGNYSQTNSPFVIGSYSVRDVTLANKDGGTTTGWELIEYHGADLSNGFSLPSNITVSESNLSYEITGQSSWGSYTHEFYVDITNNGNSAINTWSFNLTVPTGDSIVVYQAIATQHVGYYTITQPNYPEDILPGETYRVQIQVTSASSTWTPNVYDLIEAGATQESYPLISIGDYSFKHTVSLAGTEFNLTNNSLIYIGNDAFYNLSGIVNLSGDNILTIGNNAFRNNGIRYASLPNLQTIGSYAFANNANLNYLNLGKTNILPTGVLYGTINLNQLILNNTLNIDPGSLRMNITVETDAFTNCGTNIGNRFRIYVPDGARSGVTYVQAYKNTLPASINMYVFENGTLFGDDYYYDNSVYNIKHYMIKDITINGTNGWQIVDYHGPNITGDFVFPNTFTVNGTTKNVISIGDNAFRFASLVDNVKFPISSSYILRIGSYAFYNFLGISTINLPSVKTIGSYAFRYNEITYASFPTLTTIGDYALADNLLLYYVDAGIITDFSEGLFLNDDKIVQLYLRSQDANTNSNRMNFTIRNDAFTNMGDRSSNRLRIYVPDGAASGNLAYVDAYKSTMDSVYTNYIFETGSLIGSYSYSANNYEIREYMIKQVTISGSTGWQIVDYHGADIVSSYTVPNTLSDSGGTTLPVVSIGEGAYRHAVVNAGNSWDVDLPSTVVYVGDYAFYQRAVVNLSGNDLTYLGAYSFYQCNSLQTVAFGTVNVIGDYAFYQSTETTVTLGTNVQVIGDYAFYNTYNNNALRTMYISTTTPPTISQHTLPGGYTTTSTWSGTTTFNINVYVPYASEGAYESASYWNALKGQSTSWFGADWDHIRPMGDVSGYYVYEITSTNPREIKITGYTRTNTQNLTIPNSLNISGQSYSITAIEGNAFDNVTSLRTLTLPNTLRSVGDNFLGGSSSVQTISVTSGGTYFSANNGVLFSYDETSLIKYPPAKTTNNNIYSLPSSARVVIEGAFSGNTYISRVNFNANLVAISSGSFDGCSSLRTIQFGGNTPPYLLGFDIFPVYNNTSFRYPSAAYNTYNANIFYSKYSSKSTAY